ncbi:MAG: Xaa-Pro peptidase family protein [Actinomycetota bacterium]
MEYTRRREQLAKRLQQRGVDALLVTHLPNVRYLSGFTGSHAAVLATSRAVVLLTDGRYADQAKNETAGLHVVITSGEGLLRVAADRVRSLELARLGFEATMSYSAFTHLAGMLEPTELVATHGIVEGLRMRKDPDEAAALLRAQACTDAAFDRATAFLRKGITEREAALELEIAMRRAGADDVAFASIVAFGENAAEPHHAPTERVLASGDVVKMDFGARVDGYHADMTRTVEMGEAAGELQTIHDVVLAAHEAGVASLTAGCRAGEPEAAARTVVEQAGYGQRWMHPPGHGVGLEIHEAPVLRRDDSTLIPAGAMITIEPGIYVPGLGGVRIEDIIHVTEDGPVPLPSATKQLLRL